MSNIVIPGFNDHHPKRVSLRADLMQLLLRHYPDLPSAEIQALAIALEDQIHQSTEGDRQSA